MHDPEPTQLHNCFCITLFMKNGTSVVTALVIISVIQ